jgi:hypothetical protein
MPVKTLENVKSKHADLRTMSQTSENEILGTKNISINNDVGHVLNSVFLSELPLENSHTLSVEVDIRNTSDADTKSGWRVLAATFHRMPSLAALEGESGSVMAGRANDTFANFTAFINKTLQCLACKMHSRNEKCVQNFDLNA